MIENAFQDFLLEPTDACAIYEVNENYLIDFRENVQKEITDNSKQRLVGRFEGDPKSSQNTLNNINSIIVQKIRAVQPLSDSDPRFVKSSFLFDGDEAFFNYNFLDFIFRLIDKSPNKKQAIDDFVEYSVKYINACGNDPATQLKILQVLVSDLDNDNIKENAVNWYTKECFVYRMINTFFRRQKYSEIFSIRYYVYHLRQYLSTLANNKKTQKLYRGTKVPHEEMARMKNSIDQPFQLNGFISTSGDISIAKKFMNQNVDETQYCRVLFEFEAKESETKNYTSIRHFSKFPHEDEYLININIFIKISKVEEITEENISFFKVSVNFSSPEELENKINKLTKEFKINLDKLLNENITLDTFYLVKILFIQKKSDEMIEFLSKFKDTESYEYSRALGEIALAFRNKGDFKTALKYYTRNLKIVKSAVGKNNLEAGKLYNDIGLTYLDQGDYEKALKFLNKSLSTSEITLEKNYVNTAIIYSNLARIYSDQNDIEKALEFRLKSLEILKICYGNSHPEIASMYNNIATTYQDLNNNSKALDYFSESLRVYESTVGKIHPDTAKCYGNIGYSYRCLEQFVKALENYLKSKEILEETVGKNHYFIASINTRIGIVYKIKGEYDKAIHYCLMSAETNEKLLGAFHNETYISYSNLATVCETMGDFENALLYFNKALVIKEKLQGQNHSETASMLSQIANILNRKGEKDKAIEYFLKCIEIRQPIFGVSDRFVSYSYYNMINIYEFNEDYDKALEYQIKFTELNEALYGRNHQTVANCYHTIGVFYYNKGEYEKSIENYKISLDINLVTVGNDHLETAACYDLISSVYELLGNFNEAYENLKKTYEIYYKVYGADHKNTIDLSNILKEIKSKIN